MEPYLLPASIQRTIKRNYYYSQNLLLLLQIDSLEENWVSREPSLAVFWAWTRKWIIVSQRREGGGRIIVSSYSSAMTSNCLFRVPPYKFLLLLLLQLFTIYLQLKLKSPPFPKNFHFMISSLALSFEYVGRARDPPSSRSIVYY